jgi:hypothetical protein
MTYHLLQILYRALRMIQVSHYDRYSARNSSTMTGYIKDILYI